jgi:phosphotriesterase-related protein
VNFKGAPVDEAAVIAKAKPHLEEIARFGCRRFHDATPNHLGRSPKILARLAADTGIEIWTNTGIYSARNHQYVPPYARDESAEQLARRWSREHEAGVDGIKPRFIKIGVNRAPLDELDRKIVRAAALCSKMTGLTIASHTSGAGPAAMEQIEIVSAAGADPSRFVWVHAHNEKDHAFHEKAARAGAWVELDGLAPASLDWHLESIRFLAGKGLLGRALVSHDAGYFRPGEPGGGSFRPYSLLFTGLLPKLDPATAKALLEVNPVAAYGRS